MITNAELPLNSIDLQIWCGINKMLLPFFLCLIGAVAFLGKYARNELL